MHRFSSFLDLVFLGLLFVWFIYSLRTGETTAAWLAAWFLLGALIDRSAEPAEPPGPARAVPWCWHARLGMGLFVADVAVAAWAVHVAAMAWPAMASAACLVISGCAVFLAWQGALRVQRIRDALARVGEARPR
jgi:hypothetical protein